MMPDEELAAAVARHHRRVQAGMREEFDALLFLTVDLYEERDRMATLAGLPLPCDYDRLARFLVHRRREAVDGVEYKLKDEERARG